MHGVECCYIAVEMTSSAEDPGYTRREITAFQLKGSVKVPGEFYKALFTLTGQAKCEVVIQSELIFNFRIKKGVWRGSTFISVPFRNRQKIAILAFGIG